MRFGADEGKRMSMWMAGWIEKGGDEKWLTVSYDYAVWGRWLC